MRWLLEKIKSYKDPAPGVTPGPTFPGFIGGTPPPDDDKYAHINFRDRQEKQKRNFKKIILFTVLAGIVAWFSQNFFGGGKKADGPPIPPRYDYTLDRSPALTDYPGCPKDKGHQALKHFDALAGVGLSDSKSYAASALVRKVFNGQPFLCLADLPGNQGMIRRSDGTLILDKTMADEPTGATGIYAIMYETNLKRGTLAYDYSWSLADRQNHLMSFEAAALLTELSVAHQKMFAGDSTMWNAMEKDRVTGPAARIFDAKVSAAKNSIRFEADSNEIMELAGRLALPEIMMTRGFADRANTWLLNAYAHDLTQGRLHGRSMETSREFATTFGRVDNTFNATAGAKAAAMPGRFGGNKEMADAFKMIEMHRRELARPSDEGARRVFAQDRAGNMFGKLDMSAVLKDWKASGYNGNLLEIMKDRAGIRPPPPAPAATPAIPAPPPAPGSKTVS